MGKYKLKTPLTDKETKKLKVGDSVLLTGTVYTARDAAHARIAEALKKGKKLPFNLKNAVIYYSGPTPAKPGRVLGSAGPTTSGRMDAFTPLLIKKGLKGMIGKGKRNKEVRETIKRSGAVYFVATPGAGALLSHYIRSAKVIAYPELGTEAVRELKIENFPLIVANDAQGKDIFEEGEKKWRKK